MSREKILIRTSWVSTIGNAILSASKIIVGLFAGSLAVLGDGIDSATDVIISIVMIFTARIMNRPPSKKYVFGYEKAEGIATKILSLVIFYAGMHGMIPEFVGRTPVVTQTQALDEDDLVSILTEPKNAVVRQYRKMFQLEDVELEFEDAALHEIARMALARKTGARGLRSICEDVLQQTMFDLPSEEGVTKVIVTEASVKGEEQPQRIYG